MKKRLFSVAAVACAAALCTVLFAACGGEEEPGKQPGDDPVTYTITAESSADYTLTPSKTSAQAGEVITVTAESKNADKYITGVTYNGTACEEEEDGYSFTMPAANVTLAAQTGTYAEKYHLRAFFPIRSRLLKILLTRKPPLNLPLIVKFRSKTMRLCCLLPIRASFRTAPFPSA